MWQRDWIASLNLVLHSETASKKSWDNSKVTSSSQDEDEAQFIIFYELSWFHQSPPEHLSESPLNDLAACLTRDISFSHQHESSFGGKFQYTFHHPKISSKTHRNPLKLGAHPHMNYTRLNGWLEHSINGAEPWKLMLTTENRGLLFGLLGRIIWIHEIKHSCRP